MRLEHKSEVYKAKSEFKKLKNAVVYKENGEFLSLETDQLLLLDKELVLDYFNLFKEVCEHFDLFPKMVKEKKSRIIPHIIKDEPIKQKPNGKKRSDK